MPLTNERRTILQRIAKLLALAEGTNYEGEANAAREAVARLMAEHNLRMADTERDRYEERIVEGWFPGDVWWDRRLRMALAHLNGCYALMSEGKFTGKAKYYYYGHPTDLDSLDYMTELVHRQRSQAWKDYRARGGSEGKAKWLYGYAVGIEEKVRRLLNETTRRMGAGYDMRTPVKLDPYALAEKWHDEKYGKVQGVLEDPHGRSRSQSGYNAGAAANFYRGEVDRRSNRPVGYIPRLEKK